MLFLKTTGYAFSYIPLRKFQTYHLYHHRHSLHKHPRITADAIVLWDIASRHLVMLPRRFGTTYYSVLQAPNVQFYTGYSTHEEETTKQRRSQATNRPVAISYPRSKQTFTAHSRNPQIFH